MTIEKESLQATCDNLDIYRIYIKLDSLYIGDYALNDNNFIIYRRYGMGGGFPFTGVNGKMTINEISEEKLCGNFDIIITKIINRKIEKTDTVSVNGKFEGNFCL